MNASATDALHTTRPGCRPGRRLHSTVFIGLDHNWGEGPPLVFETMIFGGEFDQYQYRYSTWAEAEAGHAVAVGMVEHERDLKTNMTFDEWQAEAARLIEKRRKNRE
jgi:hypothetical protein